MLFVELVCLTTGMLVLMWAVGPLRTHPAENYLHVTVDDLTLFQGWPKHASSLSCIILNTSGHIFPKYILFQMFYRNIGIENKGCVRRFLSPLVVSTWSQTASPALPGGSDGPRTDRPCPPWGRPSSPETDRWPGCPSASGGTESRAARRNTPSPRHLPAEEASPRTTHSGTLTWSIHCYSNEDFGLRCVAFTWAGKRKQRPRPLGKMLSWAERVGGKCRSLVSCKLSPVNKPLPRIHRDLLAWFLMKTQWCFQ